MAGLFRFYFRQILPRVGGAISGNARPTPICRIRLRNFPQPPELAALMGRVGFRDVRTVFWNFGSVVLHTAKLRNSNSSLLRSA